MPFTSCNLQYELTRRQRLDVHLSAWLPGLAPYLIVVAIMSVLIWAASLRSPWYLMFVLAPLWVMRGFIAGFVNIIFVPLQHMDIVINEDMLGFMVGNQRWWAHLDSIVRIERYRQDLWTFCCYHGEGINVPTTLISDETLAHIRAKSEWRKTKEGFQASVQRGRRVIGLLTGRNPPATSPSSNKQDKSND
jgi:hypothetical protein